ncbi:MAG: low temperature requirement protein A [Actinomycetota bacterium]|nr:low temperature requirement protein A [Actinomycetota bacterium]
MDPARTTGKAESTPAEPRVSPLELFFDLVFVFAFTQVTGALAHDPTWAGLGRAVMVFLVLWWAWGAFAWLTNAVRTDAVWPRLVVLAAMAAMVVVALAVPEAFAGGGVFFAAGWTVVMTLHGALFAISAEEEHRATTRVAILRLLPTNLGAGVLLVVAGITDGGTQNGLWLAALATAYLGPYLVGVAGYTLHPGHFAERHGLVVLIALGESIVALGAGTEELSVAWPLVVTAVVGIALAGALWWCYFDREAEAAELALTARSGPDRARYARDAYSYLHIPLVMGVVLAAVGLKETLADPGHRLSTVVAVAFAGGVALYHGALAAIRLRRGSAVGWRLPVTVLGALAVLATAPRITALAALTTLASLTAITAVVGRTEAERGSATGPGR